MTGATVTFPDLRAIQGGIDLDLGPVGAPAGDEPDHEPVIGAAVLVATAFRLRDERGLVAALRQLAAAVDGFEKAAEGA